MLPRPVGRAGILASVAVLILSGSAFADTVGADGDVVTTGIQNTVDLGTVGPGTTINLDVGMTLFCAGTRHVDPGQIVTISPTMTVVPAEGGSITATDATMGPVPPEWANDTAGAAGCSGPMTIAGNEPSHVTIVAPPVVGTGYAFNVSYGRTFAPAGVSDGTSITGFTSVTFLLAVADEVADTTAPTFTGTPADIETVTTDPAGAQVTFATPAATDDRDPQPIVACDPPSGSTFAVGSTAVTCTATDATGNATDESFNVIVHLASVAWDDPVHAADVTANLGRSLPVKVRAWLDGAPLSGAASLEVSGCGSPTQTLLTLPLARQSDRWMASIDTSMLGVGCYQVELVVNGLGLGAFHLEVVDSPKTTSATRGAHRPT